MGFTQQIHNFYTTKGIKSGWSHLDTFFNNIGYNKEKGRKERRKEGRSKTIQDAKEGPKEEDNPFAMKLKKTERVQRTWDDGGLESVDLKHHEFEQPPQDPESEGKSTVKLGKALECDLDDKEE